jgi:hypothetical protein
MKKLFLTAAALAMSTSFAMADIGAGLVGNTVTLTGPDGAVTKVHYPDGSNIVLKMADGAEIPGTWRVNANSICTTAGDQPENCTPPIEEAPIVGSSGTIDGEAGSVAWAVTAGKDF